MVFTTDYPVVQRAIHKRIDSIDIVRGAVMIFMALDHVRDYVTNVRFQPEDLSRSTAALFATRWITHFCAPTFFLLAGVGIGVALSRGQRPAEMSRYLATRGLWLLVLELVITPIGWQFGFDLIPAFALVLWALGWSMIVMAALVHLQPAFLATISLIMIFGHNLADGITPNAFGSLRGLWHFLHVPGFVFPNVVFVGYPLVPWVAVMGVGSVLGRVYQWETRRRNKLLLALGITATLLFVALRFLNAYGDPVPWTSQRSSVLTVASFLNVRKYPPSLLFLLMTLGPAMIALAFAERAKGPIARFLAVYGRVPLFFYVTHIFVAHLAAVILAFAQSGEVRPIRIITESQTLPSWYGVPLWGVYLFWAAVVLALYYPCRQFARMKQTRPDWWLRYL